MSLKRFLIPDLRKILIYAFLFAFIFILPLIIFFAPTCAANIKCREAFIFSFKISVVATVPIYFVSCVYVWIYDALTKKSKRKK